MKRAKTTQCRVLSETISRIACYVSEPSVLFALAHAVEFVDDPHFDWLRSMIDLSRKINEENLWPQLRVCRSLDQHTRKQYSDVLRYVNGVELHCIDSVEWLQVPNPPEVVVNLTNVPRSKALLTWINEVKSLNVTALEVRDCMWPIVEPILASLPQLDTLRVHLDSLTTTFKLNKVLAFAATSKLTTLEFVGSKNCSASFQISSVMLDNLLVWISTQPVHSLAISSWDFRPVRERMHELYEAIASCTSLHKLSVVNTHLLGLDTMVFRRSLPMKELVLDGCHLQPQDMHPLCTGLRQSGVRRLTFSHNAAIGTEGMVAFAACLPFTSVERLTWQHTWISAQQMWLLCQGLQECSVRTLEFRNVHVDSRALKLLVDSLTTSSIESFSYQGDAFGDRICKALAKLLPCASSLKHIDLTDNNITDVGAATLADAARSNKTLERLLLDKNRVSLAGAATLAKAFFGCRASRTLSICDHGLQLVDIVRFKSNIARERKRTLRSVAISSKKMRQM